MKNKVQYLKDEKLSLSTKYIISKYVTKVGYIIGLNLEYANKRYYKELLIKKVNYDKKVFKFKPKWVFEKDSMS